MRRGKNRKKNRYVFLILRLKSNSAVVVEHQVSSSHAAGTIQLIPEDMLDLQLSGLYLMNNYL